MDPDCLPTCLAMSRLCEAKDEEEFKTLFVDEICEHHYHLPLDRLCMNGGAGDDVEDDEVEVEEFTKSMVRGTYTFTFVESSPGGCRDIDLTEGRSGSLDFVFDRDTGILKLSGGAAERLYDPEEF